MKDLYKFQIDAFTPETLPMERLAEYLAELSILFGNSDKVHFVKLVRGSAVLETAVESVAVPKVRQRLTMTASQGSSEDASAPFRKLNQMLAQDNAVGKLRRGSAIVLDFIGRNAPKLDFGPVTQHSDVQGQLVRIGGRDATAHGLIEDFGGGVWKIVTTRDVARQLSPVLYGPPIRASGMGRWYRSEFGEWILDELRLQSWEQLPDISLRQGITMLRGISSSLIESQTPFPAGLSLTTFSSFQKVIADDPIARLLDLRGNDENGD